MKGWPLLLVGRMANLRSGVDTMPFMGRIYQYSHVCVGPPVPRRIVFITQHISTFPLPQVYVCCAQYHVLVTPRTPRRHQSDKGRHVLLPSCVHILFFPSIQNPAHGLECGDNRWNNISMLFRRCLGFRCPETPSRLAAPREQDLVPLMEITKMTIIPLPRG